MEDLIAQLGYAAIFAGTFLEGETILALGGVAAAPAVIVLRFLYGLRIAGPIVIGSCGISPWRLAFFNFIGTLGAAGRRDRLLRRTGARSVDRPHAPRADRGADGARARRGALLAGNCLAANAALGSRLVSAASRQ